MSGTGTQTWSFRALDTLFFRESRPMESIGNAELSSLFPPSARTMIGAIRSVLGELYDVDLDWRKYHEQKERHELAKLIGYGDNLGPLAFSGVWIHKNGERFYPAPLNIMRQKGDDEKNKLFFITIGKEPVQTDLGKIRLPLLQKGQIGSKPLENLWLPGSEFSKILRGEVPDLEQCVRLLPQPSNVGGGHLLVEEARVGIARDNARRVVEKGLLYQTRHVRLADDVSLCMDVSGLSAADSPAENHLTRLGGEGRMASISVESTPLFLPQPDWNADAKGVALYLLTPLLIGRSGGDWQPLPGFKRYGKNGQTHWEGELNGVALTLHAAVTGKAQREGGWDLQKHAPRAVKSYIPVGSVFYCTGSDEPLKLIQALHGLQIGKEQELGRGKIAVGLWRE